MRTLTVILVVLGVAGTEGLSQSWMPVIPNRAVYSICVDPQDPLTLYAGNVARTIFKSTDGGTVWEERAVGTQGGSSLIEYIGVHPTKSNIVFAGGQGMSGLDRSTDGGATWNTVLDTPDGFRFEIGGTGAVTFDPNHPDTMYALRFTYGEVYRSTDAGATWSKLSTLPDIESTDNMRAITVCPDSSNLVMVSGRRCNIYRSTDYGVTWTVGKALTTYRDTDVGNFAWSPSTPGVVYATTQMSLFYNTTNAGLFKSSDYGVTWSRIALVDTSTYAIAINPTKGADELFIGGCQPTYPFDNGTIRGDSMVFRSNGIDTLFEQFSDVPWTENESGIVGYNVYGFAISRINGIPTLFMASNGGVFRSTYITSVEVDETIAPSPTLQIVGQTFTVPEWMKGACQYIIVNACGMELQRGTCTSGQRVHVSQAQSVLQYVVVTNGTDVTRGIIFPG